MSEAPDRRPGQDPDPGYRTLLERKITVDAFASSRDLTQEDVFSALIEIGTGHGEHRTKKAALDLIFDVMSDLVDGSDELRVRLRVNQLDLDVALGGHAPSATSALAVLLDESQRLELHPETQLQIMHAIARIEVAFAPITRRASSLERLHMFALEAAPESAYVVASAIDLADLYAGVGSLDEAVGYASTATIRMSSATPAGLIRQWAAVVAELANKSSGHSESVARLVDQAVHLTAERLGPEHPGSLRARQVQLVFEDRATEPKAGLGRWEQLLHDHERCLGRSHPRTLAVTVICAGKQEANRSSHKNAAWWTNLIARIDKVRLTQAGGTDEDLEFAYAMSQSGLADAYLRTSDDAAALAALRSLLETVSSAFEADDDLAVRVRARIDHVLRHSESTQPEGDLPSLQDSMTSRRGEASGSRNSRLRRHNEARRVVGEFGYLARLIGAQCDDPGCTVVHDDRVVDFGYTVGLSEKWDHPEIVVTGLPQMSCGVPIKLLADQVLSGSRFKAGAIVESMFPQGYSGTLIEVDPRKSAEFLTLANALYRRPGRPPVPALQVVWPDPDGRFPWEGGCSTSPGVQPLWGEPPAGVPRSAW